MDEKTIRKIIRLRFRRLKKYWSGVVNAFDMDAIHDFRVEYKKLRAFLRMLSTGSDHHKIKIPQSLQDVYKHAGPVRDTQVLTENIGKKRKEPGKPVNYLRRLKRKLASDKTVLKKVMQPRVLQDAKRKIEKKIPGKLEASAIESFAVAKMTVISNMTSGKVIRDNEMHTVRKCMKDIVYNARTFETDLSVPFPWKDWNAEKEKCFTEVTDGLGRFQDSCTALLLFKERYDNAPGKEKELINGMKRRQQQLKSRLKRTVRAKFADARCFQL